ncbi:hypothetical protein QWY31_07510 [Cytophagales bacterium LB-30]|uniref:Conjugal transfer protein n=2 Tax=Shiella aurantiaca TaxID=3058365 RepID=A0ABT8F4E8_9BACT|nr:hypothetical protein [Shiella aurantiaca]
MDEIGNWIYVIVGIIYMISRVLKTKKPAEQVDTGSSRPARPKTQPVTFEDLLKELTGEVPEPAPKPVQRRAEVQDEPYEHPFSKKKSQEVRRPEPDYSISTFSEDKTSRFNKYKEKKDISLETSYKSQPISERKNLHDDPYHEKAASNETASKVKEMLVGGPEDLKKAIILSEILNRKY